MQRTFVCVGIVIEREFGGRLPLAQGDTWGAIGFGIRLEVGSAKRSFFIGSIELMIAATSLESAISEPVPRLAKDLRLPLQAIH